MADMAQVASITFQGIDATSGVASGVSSAITGVESAATRAGGALLSMAAGAAKLAVAVGAISFTAVTAGIASSVTTAASFEKQMSAVTAVMDQAQLAAVGGSKALSDLALQLGAQTSFSASEAAQGLEELAKAGVSVQDIMGGGAKASLDLAAAGGISVADAAAIASNAMNTFNKSGAEMGGIADTISGAANASAIDVHQFGLSLSSVGAVAATVGVSFEDTATAIAVLGQNGLKGSDAGTSLKTMLLNLSPANKAAAQEMQALGIITAEGANQFFTAEGKAKGLADISQILQDATANLTQEQKLNALQTIFGTDAIRASAIMANNGAAGFTKMSDAMAASGGASAVADARLDNLAGSIEKMKGSIETASITFGLHLLPTLKRVTDAATELVNKAIPGLDKLGETAAGMLDTFISKASGAIPSIVSVGGALLRVGQSILPTLAAGAVKAGLAAETMIAQLLGLSVEDYANSWDLLGGIITRSGELIVTAVGGIVSAVQAGWPMVVSTFQTVLPIVESIGKAFVDNIATQITFVVERVLPPLISIVQQTAGLLTSTLLPAAQQTGEVFRSVLGDSLDWLAATAWPPLLAIAQQTATFWTSTLLPVIPPLVAALRTALGETLQWLATTGWPAFLSAATVAVNFLSQTVIPAIVPVAAAIRTGLGAAIEWISTTGWPLFLAAARTATTFITGTIIPAVQSLITWLQTNLPPAINAVMAVWETLRGKLAPIVQAIFSGDIKTAIAGLGTAFSEFATLALGWLGDQVKAIDWAAVWANAVTLATDLATYVAGLTVDFVTWLGQQVTAIPWATVWANAVTIATDLGTYVAGLAVDFATWLGAQVTAIPWATVWAKAVTAASALGTWIATQAVDFATWLTAQVGLIPWDVVWLNVKTAGVSLGTYLLTQVVDFATWLKAQVALIPWADVWKSIVGMKQAAQLEFQTQMSTINWYDVLKANTEAAGQFYQWLTDTITAVDWQALGETAGTLLGTMISRALGLAGDSEETQKAWGSALVASATGADWETVGTTVGTLLGKMMATAVAADAAWSAFATGFSTAMVKAITGMTVTEIVTALTTKFSESLSAAWGAAVGAFAPSIPNPFAPKPGAAPGGPTPGQGPGGQGTTTNYKGGMPSSYTGEWERKAYQYAVAAGHEDPVQFVEQIREESGLDPNTPASNMGAQGIAQIMPATARAWGVDPNDPEAALQAAAQHSAAYRRQYGPQLGLAAYNAGEGNVARYGTGVFDPSFASGQTMRYESEINARTQAIHASEPSGAVLMGGPANGPTGPNAAGITNFRQTQQEWDRQMADANDICGPYLASLFADAIGRPPDANEARQLAISMGMYRVGANGQGSGILNAGAFPSYANALLQQTNPGTSMQVQQTTGLGNFGAQQLAAGSLAQGSPLVGFNTQNHYFGATQFDPTSGAFNVGGTGLSLAGGKEWMTVDEMTAKMGPLIGVLTLVDTAAQGDAVAFKGMADQAAVVNPAIAQMTQDSILSVDQMGERITTFSTDTMGSFITTTTDTTGAVVGLWGEMSNGVQLNMADTAAGVTTTVQGLGTTLLTTTQDTAGNMIATVTDQNGQILAQWSALSGQVTTTNATMGNSLITQTNASTGQVNSIFATGGQQQVTTAQTTATGVVAANTDMGTQSVAQVQGMSGTILQSVTDMGNGITMTVTTTANGTVTTLTDWSGKVVGVYTETESQTSEAVALMGTNAEDAMNTVASSTGIATDALGDVTGAFKGSGDAAADATPPVEDFGSAAKSIKPPSLSAFASQLGEVAKQAKEASKQLQAVAGATNLAKGANVKGLGGGGKDIVESGAAAASGVRDAVGQSADMLSGVLDSITEVIGGSVGFNEAPVFEGGTTGGNPPAAVTPSPHPPENPPVPARLQPGTGGHGPSELPPQHPELPPAPVMPILFAPSVPDVSEFDQQLTELGRDADDSTQRMSTQLQKNFAVMVKNMTAQGILVDRNVTGSTEDMADDSTRSTRTMQTRTVDAATGMQTGVTKAATSMADVVDDAATIMGGTVTDRAQRMADDTATAAGSMRRQVTDHANGMESSVAFAADTMRGSAVFQTQQMRDGMAVAAGEARDATVLAIQSLQTNLPTTLAAVNPPTMAVADTLKLDLVQRFIDAKDGALTAIGLLKDPATGLPFVLDDVGSDLSGSDGPAEKLGKKIDEEIAQGVKDNVGKIGRAVNDAIDKALRDAQVPNKAAASALSLGPSTSAIDLAMPAMQGGTSTLSASSGGVVFDLDYARLAKLINEAQRDNFNYTVYSQATTSTAVQDVETMRTLAQTR